MRFNWYNTTDSSSATSGAFLVGTDRWYHLAVTFDGSIYSLYVDGILISSVAGSAPAASAANIKGLVGAIDQGPSNTPTSYFHGWIDELKIWNKAISVEHIRQMMNQEIIALGADVGGVVIPTKIYGPDINGDGLEDNPYYGVILTATIE